MTIDNRTTGWLNQSMHAHVRELLLHTCTRYHLHCPAYCLMPDHAHFLWMGLNENSHQLNAAKFFRRHWNTKLKEHGVQLQTQAYDHVLLESERNPEAFEDTVLYIFHNPQRAELISEWPDWPHLGSIIPGYPDLPINLITDFWPNFWKIHNAHTSA
ncbi:MAG: hypothetical protein AAGC74_04525 [Verrucomicrobiota bacterium]